MRSAGEGARAFVLALLACTACHPDGAARSRTVTIRSCHYQVELSANGLALVDAKCEADGPVTFRVAESKVVASVSSRVPGQAGQFRSPNQRLSYRVDLAQLAGAGHDFDRAARVGASFIGTMSSVLLVPEPLTTEIPVTVQVTAPPGVDVAVGLAQGKSPQGYRLMAHEIPVATYFAFGKLEQRTLDIDGARLEVTRLDSSLDRSFDELNAWIAKSADAVHDFYGAFPVPRASVMLLPVPGRDGVVFGKVLPESEPAVALLVGQHAPTKALYSDWILVHELFHLGFPSFFDEGKWLDEGLATYYEPIIRVRAGLYTEAELWKELAASMPQGLQAFERQGLEHATDFRGIYWGGAIACLVADVEARKRDVKRGLEVGLRALRDSGANACEVWSLADTIGTIDKALGAPTLAPIAAAHARRGSAFDLQALLRDLGVSVNANGSVKLSDHAPLAAVRRAITVPP
ncbi:MAG TPA: hypothetical protein VHP33_19975 [Polyangiaceae bacterium]|nr:hypothetical protein [Polyangiaceae bacterium]